MSFGAWVGALARQGRVTRLRRPGAEIWIAAERLAKFQALWAPIWLDDECLAGRVSWARWRPRNERPNGVERGATPVRTTPITLLARRSAPLWQALSANGEARPPRGLAQAVAYFVREHVASFSMNWSPAPGGDVPLAVENREAVAAVCNLRGLGDLNKPIC